jgi:ligand-binding sensor domain-containing protein/cbb3-type cytochrome oxidase subunit 3
MKQIILAAFVFVFCFSGYANYPLVRNFQRETYKAGTQNWAIVQDDKNSMCFANNNGLLIFDGKKWTTVPIKNGTNVRSVLYTKDGRFYASTFNEFGYFKKYPNNHFVYFSLSEKLNLNKQESNALFSIIDGNKIIYFQGEKNIYEYDGSKIQKISFNSKIDASAYINNVLFITSQQKGVYMLNGNQFVRLPGSEILISKRVRSIVALNSGNILFVTNFDGVYLFNGITFIPYNTGIDNFLKENQVFCATKKNNKLVFGTVQRGIAILNLTDKAVTYVNTFTGLQNNTVLSMAFDSQMNLWLGLDKGIDHVLLNDPVQSILGTNSLYGSGYTSFLKENTLYLGTNQGLYTTPFPPVNNPAPVRLKLIRGMEGQIWCLTEIDGKLFCGDDQGAFIISPDKVERIDKLNGTWNFKPFLKRKDLILGCCYQGLFVLKKSGDSWKFSHFIKGNFSESSPMFEEDTDGTIWFSHWLKGMFRLTLNSEKDSIVKIKLYNKKGFPTNQDNTVFRIDNRLIFSSESGFFTYNPKTDRMDAYTKWDKLFNKKPGYMRLHESTNGDIWFVSGRFIGLALKQSDNSYKMDSFSYRILQPKIITGFEHFNCINNSNFIISTEDGFDWVNTKKRNSLNGQFKVLIDKVDITNTKLVDSGQQNPDSNTKLQGKYLHSQNSLKFEVVAPEYRGEDLVKYSYILENYDEKWSEFSSDNTKEYTHLPKGNYIFKVRARDILESKEALCSYSFTILPAWYETRIAFVIYLLLVIMLIVAIVIFINQQSKKGAIDMERMKEIELNEQKKKHEAETSEKKKEIKELKNQQLQYELRHKSQELASSTMNLIRKNVALPLGVECRKPES